MTKRAFTADRCRLPLSFDPNRLRQDLDQVLEADWIDHFNRHDYDGGWSVAPLRQPAGAVHPIQAVYSDPSAVEYVDSPLLSRCPYFASVLRTFACPLKSARLMRLRPGSTIKEHRDHGLTFADGEARIHIPVCTNPQVAFVLSQQPVEMGEGEAWYLDFTLPHRVANMGATDRVHLVVDCVVDAWLRGLLRTLLESTKNVRSYNV